MTLIEAVGSVLSQYAGFRGRARRSEFWWWQVFSLLLGLLIGLTEVSLGMASEDGGPVSTLVGLALLAPNLAVCVRRLHDTSRTGWWVLVGLVPFVGFAVLLWFFVADSAPGANAHGDDPKAPVTSSEAAGVGEAGWVPPGWELPSPDEPTPRPSASDSDSDSDGRGERPPG